MNRRSPALLLLFVPHLFWTPAPADAAWPPEIRNLQVLDPETELREVVGIMRGFARSLGVRCQHCHIYEGDDPNDLSTFDFAADDKESKRTARVMIEMTRTLNETLLEPVRAASEHEPVEVNCETCHRGRERPEMIQSVVARRLETEGVEAAVAEYRELREAYYGGHSFDFTDGPLNFVAERLLRAGNAAAAIALLEANLGYHPEAEGTRTLYAEALLQNGDREAGRRELERILEINPENPAAAAKLVELEAEEAPD